MFQARTLSVELFHPPLRVRRVTLARCNGRVAMGRLTQTGVLNALSPELPMCSVRSLLHEASL
jgi:hypothetical protein